MKKVGIFFFVLFIFASGGFIWWTNGKGAVNNNDKSQHIFVVEKGQNVRQIANELKKERLIKDPVVFFLLVKKLQLDQKIQAGSFRISPSQSAEEIAQALTHGTLDVWVTLPEGIRAQEIADILEKSMPTYKPTWRLTLDQFEGYLFPDTYLFPKDGDINTIVSIMRNNFEQKFATILQKNRHDLSREHIVIIASLIEREAKLHEDRPLVASVILNRLDNGIRLQIDATVQYALGYQRAEKRWWKKSLSYKDLELNSPYNTYINTGLPPTPIANPGLDALKAVMEAPETDYLFYISDSSGKNHYARTNEEHETNKRKYGL